MRKIHVLGAFIAVFTFSALAVSNASATLWLINGASLRAETSVSTHVVLLLHDSLGILVKCTGLYIGAVGPEALDLITLAEDLHGNKDLMNCEITQDTYKLCGNVAQLVIVHILNLPWHTLLELNGTETIDRTLPVTAGYEVLCPSGSIARCEIPETSKFLGNDSDGALFAFTGENTCPTPGVISLLGTFLVLGATVS